MRFYFDGSPLITSLLPPSTVFKAGEIKDFTVNNYLALLKSTTLILCPKIKDAKFGLLK